LNYKTNKFLNFNIRTIKHQDGFKYRAQPQKKSKKFFNIFLFSFFIILIYILFTYVLPSVSVIVVPSTENYEKEFEVGLTADQSQVDIQQNIFLAKFVSDEFEESGTFNATGEKDFGKKATGQALFFNQTGRPQPITK